MRILVLTSINPVISCDIYSLLVKNYKIWKKEKKDTKEVDFWCFPLMAELARINQNKEYLPSLFSLMKTSIQPKFQKKLFESKPNTVMVGNTYKSQKFDIVVSLQDVNEDEVFDHYIEILKNEKGLETFVKKSNIEQLYTLKDAEYNFYNIDHLVLFLKEAIRGKNKFKR